MVKDAESHAADDEAKKKLIDLRNQADQLVYSTGKMLDEHGGKVAAAVRTEIEQAVNRLKDVAKGDDAAVIERAIKDLTTASYKVGEAVYKSAAASGPAPAVRKQAPPPAARPVPWAPNPKKTKMSSTRSMK